MTRALTNDGWGAFRVYGDPKSYRKLDHVAVWAKRPMEGAVKE